MAKIYPHIRKASMHSALSARDQAKGTNGRLYAMTDKSAKPLRVAELVQKVYEHARLAPIFDSVNGAAAAAGQQHGAIITNIQNAMGTLQSVRRSLRAFKPSAKAAAAAEAAGRGGGRAAP